MSFASCYARAGQSAHRIELPTPTSAMAIPTKTDSALGRVGFPSPAKGFPRQDARFTKSGLGYEPFSKRRKARIRQTENPNALPASTFAKGYGGRVVALSRSTQGRGLARLFHPSTPGSPSVMNATIPAMSADSISRPRIARKDHLSSRPGFPSLNLCHLW